MTNTLKTDDGLRVLQSVQLVSHLPAIVFINVTSALVMSLLLTNVGALWKQMLPVLVIWPSMLPLLASWLRLQGRPVPQAVSTRRIRRIVEFSLYLGAAWGGLMLYLLPGQPPVVIALLATGLSVQCMGFAAIMSNFPLACLAFTFPLMGAGLYVAGGSDFESHVWVAFVMILYALGIGWILLRSMQPLLEISSLKTERDGLVANLIKQLEAQRELTAQREATQAQLAKSEARYRALSKLSSDWYWEQDENFRFIKDFSDEHILLPDIRDLSLGLTRWELAPDNPDELWQKHRADLDSHCKFTDFEYQVKTSVHGVRWCSVSGEPRYDEAGHFTGYVGVGKDITQRKQAEAAINQLAYFDALTGLPNRRFLLDRLTELQASCRRTGMFSALVFFDLDNFKNINDARGHLVGDGVLKEIANRMAALLRTEDTAARLGGDEFVVLAANLSDDIAAGIQAAQVVADRIRATASKPIEMEGHTYLVGCSVGVTLFPSETKTPDDLLREADTAMYAAKEKGRNQTVFFEASMQTSIEKRLELETDLAQAEQRGQLSLYVQPQVDNAGRCVSAELLMRWQHPVHGFVSPATFIPIAESSRLILELGSWVLAETCAISVRFDRKGIELPLSINVSPKQFRLPDFVDLVVNALASSGARATMLIFEVTEGLLIDEMESTIAKMQELVAIGIRFSIDDFGTGYSSMAYLKRLPLYELKIDKSFVQDVPDDVNGAAIVHAMLAMAKHLQLRVVAEGVETRRQADFLRKAGCDCSQGYLYARPMPVDVWLAEGPMLKERALASPVH